MSKLYKKQIAEISKNYREVNAKSKKLYKYLDSGITKVWGGFNEIELFFNKTKETRYEYKLALRNLKRAIEELDDLADGIENLKESKQDFEIYHKTFSDCVTEMQKFVKKKGYELDPDDFQNRITHGIGKPALDKTNNFKLGLTKKGKEVKNMLIMNVYGMKSQYELTLYIS